ncbi:MAG TPA: discoidin domain-containing protein, partial [Egibacteraceae bacterium]
MRLWLTGSTALNMAELEVYGRPAGQTPSVSGAPPAAEGSSLEADAVRLVWAAGSPAPTIAEVITWSADDAGVRLSVDPDALTVEPGGSATTTVVLDARRADSVDGSLLVDVPAGLTVTPDALDVAVNRGQQRRIELRVAAAGDYAVVVAFDTGTAPPLAATVPVTVPLATGDENLALAGTATASSVEVPQLGPQLAIDGDLSTRWASAYSDAEWLQVELAAPARVGKVVLVWEAAYGRAYEIQVSADGVTWTTAAAVSDGDGGTDVVYLDAPQTRFVRMQGIAR